MQFYRTAYLNISYVDTDRNVWHTERTETGRFSKEGIREVAGIAVEIISAVPVVTSSDGRKEYDRFGLQ